MKSGEEVKPARPGSATGGRLRHPEVWRRGARLGDLAAACATPKSGEEGPGSAT